MVMRRPALSAGLAATILLVLAIPALSLQYGNGALRMFPEDHEVRRGADLAAAQVGPGASSPLLIVADFRRGTVEDNQAALDRYVDRVAATPGVASVEEP